MKSYRMKIPQNTPDAEKTISQCVETVEGLETAHINLATGEITYSKGSCVDEQALRNAFAEQGIELEEMKCYP